PGQGELFSVYRHHGIFTDSPLVMLQAETTHRDHAIVEQVIADMKSGPVARSRGTQTTAIYEHADPALKERAIARTAPLGAKPGRYRPSDTLMAFLECL
ncbi:MAG TPA: hypothetical protein VIJ15_14445, partial [Dermatophilaceae bacterium]